VKLVRRDGEVGFWLEPGSYTLEVNLAQ